MQVLTGGAEIAAPAKVNLFLRIAGRREDGFHELETIMQTVDLCDQLSFQDTPELAADQLTCEAANLPGGAVLPADASNLILRAVAWVRARMVQQGLPPAPPQRIHLIKRIPIGAGLGGGSSDAAATLRALEQKWNLPWPVETWRAGALELGSDVPFCHAGGGWRCTGRGEQLSSLSLRLPPALALLCPAIAVPTAQVYAAYHRMMQESRHSDSPGAAVGQGHAAMNLQEFLRLPWREWRGCWRNDLTESACRVARALRPVRVWFEQNRLIGGMSGSGSTFVAACDSLRAAAEVGACFEREFPASRSFAVAPVPSTGRKEALPSIV